MEIRVDTAEFDAKNRREVEIESAKGRKHCPTSEHNVKMPNYVKCIVEKDVHSCMRNAHTTNAPRNEKKNKRKSEQQREFQNE